MEFVLRTIQTYSSIFILGSLSINVILIVLLAVNYSVTSSLKDKYKRLMKGTSGKNIEDVLMQHIDKVQEVQEEFKDIYTKIDVLDNRMSFCIQNVGIVRYNAFEDVGSDLSYSVAILDENNNGILLTGIHGRNETVSYAKPIKNGSSNYNLSVEEMQALERAKSNDLDKIQVKGIRSQKNVG
ncbi:MAG: DUF4446 family protein [Clostridiaceae bacterium]|nr:DUF4446 family protein [Clostridiaceae bacterium]